MRKRRAKASGQELTEDDAEADEEAESLEETLSWADSLAFPILGSIALLSLWALLKYVGKEWLDLFLGVYCKSVSKSLWIDPDGFSLRRWRLCNAAGEVVERTDGCELTVHRHWTRSWDSYFG